MAWYTTGTISGDNNIIVGNGTSWGKPIYGIGPGQILLIPGSGAVQLFEIASVDSDTQITLVAGPTAPISNSAYAILSFYGGSYADFGRQLSAFLAEYQTLLGIWQQFLTGTEDINLTMPDGNIMVLKSLSEIQAIADEAATAGMWYENNKTNIEQAGAYATAAKTSETNASESAAQAQQSVVDVVNSIDDMGLLKAANNFSEIKDGGPAAQATARDNLGITGTGGGGGGALQFADAGAVNAVVIFGEVLKSGNTVNVTGIVATNTGPATISINGADPVPITAMGGSSLQGNELVAGGDIVLVITETGATLTATTGGNLPVAPGIASGHAATIGQLNAVDEATLKTGNNFSEIKDAGPAAQAAAQANLGISGGGGAGQLLGTMLITTSGTYNLLAGTNTIYAELCAGGGSGQYHNVTSSGQRSFGMPGLSSDSFLVSFPKSALSTFSSNTIIVTIGLGGAPATTASSASPAAGSTIIDNSSFISLEGIPQLLGNLQGFRLIQTNGSPIFDAISYRIIVDQQGVANQRLVNEITVSSAVTVLSRKNAGALNGANACVGFAMNPQYGGYVWVPKPMCFFPYGQYGMGGLGFSVGASYPGAVGSPGTAGAVMLFMYS